MKKLVAFMLAAFLASPLIAEDKPAPQTEQKISKISGQVTDVRNSVIFKIKDDKGAEHTIRLAHIGTPYLNKPFGPESLDALKKLIDQQKVECDVVQTDRLGKMVARVQCNNKSVQEEMVKAGYAWVSKKYSTPELLALQEKAKEAKVGLWSASTPPAAVGAKGMKANVKLPAVS